MRHISSTCMVMSTCVPHITMTRLFTGLWWKGSDSLPPFTTFQRTRWGSTTLPAYCGALFGALCLPTLQLTWQTYFAKGPQWGGSTSPIPPQFAPHMVVVLFRGLWWEALLHLTEQQYCGRKTGSLFDRSGGLFLACLTLQGSSTVGRFCLTF